MIGFDPLEVQGEATLMTSRRAFPEAQAALAGATERVLAVDAVLGWVAPDVHPESGSVAFVDPNGRFAELVGDLVAIRRVLSTGADRVVYAVVVSGLTLPEGEEIALARRAFFGLGHLANEELTVSVELVR